MKQILKLTIRNLVRNPVINIINLAGLAISLALAINLSVYCYSEFTTDNFHKNGDRVYLYGDLERNIYSPGILKEQIDLNVPEVESTVRVAGAGEPFTFQVNDNEPVTSEILFADKDFFKLFTYKEIEGNLGSALQEPLSIVITKTLAGKLFGKESALGKTLKLNNERNLTVRAVIERPHGNSILSFNAVTSVATRKIVRPGGEDFTNWRWRNFQTFLLLKNGAKPEETAEIISSLYPEDIQKSVEGLKLMPLKTLYFSDAKSIDINYLLFGNKKKVMILLFMAILVLVVAVINFINIFTSQRVNKIRQTGIMKMNGASRSGILLHILLESFVFYLFALFTALLLAGITAPFFSDYTGIHFNKKLICSSTFLLISVAGVFVLSMIISLLAASRISTSKAINNLKGKIQPHNTNSVYRGILVTAQFVIAIVLIAFTILVQKQVNFGSTGIGFSQENIIGIRLTRELYAKIEVIKNSLSDYPLVKKVSLTGYYPGQPISHWGRIQQTIDGENKRFEFDIFAADAAFFEIMGLKLTEGRFYSDSLSSETGSIVVNETFVREHNLTKPIGTKIPGSYDRPTEIIGVVKDFHYKPFNYPIGPLAILNEEQPRYCLVNLSTNDFNSLNNTIKSIKTIVSRLSPSSPVEISFLDQAVENMYQSELQFRQTFSLFAGCAIFICCLGILAMSLFSCQYRIKEIGIRKINGAKTSEILTMLNRDFVKWVAIAFVIATPIAWYAMHKWLENFAYKTNLSWWIFALAGLLALGIALLTVSYQSYKAAVKNPIESLRYE